MKKVRGFTLIEILVVIGIIAILAAVVIIAINPARQFAQARNSQRESNVNSILNAIGQNLADNKGTFTCSGIGTAIGSATTTIGTGSTNLTCLTPTYLAGGVPMDPSVGNDANTGYTISYDANSSGRYLVCADKSNESNTSVAQSICVTR